MPFFMESYGKILMHLKGT